MCVDWNGGYYNAKRKGRLKAYGVLSDGLFFQGLSAEAFGFADEVVGVDFEAVLEIHAVGIGAFAADRDVGVDLGDVFRFGNIHYGLQQVGAVAASACLRHGNGVVYDDVAAEGEGGGDAEAAYGNGVVFAFFEDAQQSVAGGALFVVDLCGEAGDVVQRRAQDAEGGEGGGGFFGRDFAEFERLPLRFLRCRAGRCRRRSPSGSGTSAG